jgi:hypothetical protein
MIHEIKWHQENLKVLREIQANRRRIIETLITDANKVEKVLDFYHSQIASAIILGKDKFDRDENLETP